MMKIRRPDEARRFVTSDDSEVVEVFHPDRENLPNGMACSIAHARVAAGSATAPHSLATSTEVYWILSGRGQMHIDAETSPVEPGDAVLIPPGSVQWIETAGREDLVFLCVVTPPWKAGDDCRRTAAIP
jgi:mannose-6-phosphate isomerase-like protein (cupin superfamily)